MFFIYDTDLYVCIECLLKNKFVVLHMINKFLNALKLKFNVGYAIEMHMHRIKHTFTDPVTKKKGQMTVVGKILCQLSMTDFANTRAIYSLLKPQSLQKRMESVVLSKVMVLANNYQNSSTITYSLFHFVRSMQLVGME